MAAKNRFHGLHHELKDSRKIVAVSHFIAAKTISGVSFVIGFVICCVVIGITGNAFAGQGEKPNTLESLCAGNPPGKVTQRDVATPVIVPPNATRGDLLPRHRRFPNDRIADLLLVKGSAVTSDTSNTAKSPGLTYKVVVLDLAVKGGSVLNVLSLRQGTDVTTTEAVTKPIDFSANDDKREKTLVSFRMNVLEGPITAMENWYRPVDVYVLGCSNSDGPSTLQAFGSMQSTVISQVVCRVAAVIFLFFAYLCAVLSVSAMRRKKMGIPAGPAAPLGLAGRTPGFLNHLDPIVLSAGDDGKGSVAKLQMLFFSMIVLWLVFYIWLMTEHLSALSETVLLLMGITGIGSTAAAGAELSKNRLSLDNWAWLVNERWLPTGGMAMINMPRWRDIFTTNAVFDVPRFQLVTFSIVVGMGLLATGTDLADLSTYSIPTQLLSILGLSQIVYIAGKLVAPPSVAQLDEQLSKVRDAEVENAKAQRAYRSAADAGVVTADQKKTADDAEAVYAVVKKVARTSFVSVYPIGANQYF